MIIKKLKIEDFGKFHNKTIELQEGINIFYGPNEAGKSTIHSFIKSMLVGNEKPRGREGKDDIYTKYLPWETPLQYKGIMEFEDGSDTYVLERNFHKDAKKNQIINLNTGRSVEFETNEEIEPLKTINKSSYQNTISVEQLKAVTDKKLGSEIQNYITNMASSYDSNIDISEASKHLKAKKREVAYEKTVSEIEAISEKIEQGENKLLRLKELDDLIQEKEERIGQLKSSIQGEKLDIPYKEVYNSYNNYLSRKEDLLQQEAQKEQIVDGKGKTGLSKLIVAIMIVAIGVLFSGWYWKTAAVMVSAVIVLTGCIMLQIVGHRRRGEGADAREKEHREGRLDQELEILKKDLLSKLKLLHIKEDNFDIPEMMKQLERMRDEAFLEERKKEQMLSEERLAFNKLLWERDNLKEVTIQIKRYEHKYEQLQKIRLSKKEDLEAIAYALEHIEKLAGKLHDEFSISMNQKLSKYIYEFTEGRYENAFLDENAKIQLFSEGKLVKLEQLSVGTIHQIYLALRIVVGESLYGYGDMPVILDDYFAYYDDERLQCALKQLAGRKQVLIFSCHEREYKILEKLNIKFHLISVTR